MSDNTVELAEMTPEILSSLSVGDRVELGSLFEGMSKEPIHLDTAAIGAHGVDFVARWHGVTLGRWTAIMEEGVVKWQIP